MWFNKTSHHFGRSHAFTFNPTRIKFNPLHFTKNTYTSCINSEAYSNVPVEIEPLFKTRTSFRARGVSARQSTQNIAWSTSGSASRYFRNPQEDLNVIVQSLLCISGSRFIINLPKCTFIVFGPLRKCIYCVRCTYYETKFLNYNEVLSRTSRFNFLKISVGVKRLFLKKFSENEKEKMWKVPRGSTPLSLFELTFLIT